ncbi:unnamed protein product, partial [Allacma fusca]
NRGSKCELIR